MSEDGSLFWTFLMKECCFVCIVKQKKFIQLHIRLKKFNLIIKRHFRNKSWRKFICFNELQYIHKTFALENQNGAKTESLSSAHGRCTPGYCFKTNYAIVFLSYSWSCAWNVFHMQSEMQCRVGTSRNTAYHCFWNKYQFVTIDNICLVIVLVLFSGIILEYEQSKTLKTKSIDLLDLKPEWVYFFWTAQYTRLWRFFFTLLRKY